MLKLMIMAHKTIAVKFSTVKSDDNESNYRLTIWIIITTIIILMIMKIWKLNYNWQRQNKNKIMLSKIRVCLVVMKKGSGK